MLPASRNDRVCTVYKYNAIDVKTRSIEDHRLDTELKIMIVEVKSKVSRSLEVDFRL